MILTDRQSAGKCTVARAAGSRYIESRDFEGEESLTERDITGESNATNVKRGEEYRTRTQRE